jgi:tRNA nucleotidyltransferase/poly(A) polymerase
VYRAIRFKVSKEMEFDKKIEEFLSSKASSLVIKQSATQKHYKAELRKMLEETVYFAECFDELLKYQLIIGQPSLFDDNEREQGSRT